MRDIRIRARSVEQSLKVTTAMKLISTSKLRKSRRRLDDSRPYFEAIKRTLHDLLERSGEEEPSRWFDKRANVKSRKTATLVITSDKGLAGAYNHSVVNFVEANCPRRSILMPLGNVGKRYFMQEDYILLEDFPSSTKEPTVDEARDIAAFVSSLFLGGQIDEFRVVYTKMYSAVKQEPEMISLLPFTHERLEPGQRARSAEGTLYEYLPDEAVLFDHLAPKYLKGMIYGALVESFASEQMARMTAMDAASKNAKTMLERLNLLYNRARQAAITREVTEIVAGAAALE
jgi:F-type H+-transporting ATPase subunit gamma